MAFNKITPIHPTEIPTAPEWCKDLLPPETSLTVGINIIIIALISLILQKVLYNYYDWMKENSPFSEETLNKIYMMLSDFSLYLLIAYMIWFLWLK